MRTRRSSTSQQRTFSVQSFLPGTSQQKERRKEKLQISVKQVGITSGQYSSDPVRAFRCLLFELVGGLTTGRFRLGVPPTFTAPYKPTGSPLVRLFEYPPESWPMVAMTPASVLRSVSNAAGLPSLDSVANALTIPPIHVEHVADAICIAIEDQTVRGPVGVRDMRRLIGWEMLGNRRCRSRYVVGYDDKEIYIDSVHSHGHVRIQLALSRPQRHPCKHRNDAA
jgi:hypothetical protein